MWPDEYMGYSSGATPGIMNFAGASPPPPSAGNLRPAHDNQVRAAEPLLAITNSPAVHDSGSQEAASSLPPKLGTSLR